MKKTKQITGSGFYEETILATVTELVKILGEPQYGRGDVEDKVQYDWEMETDDGQYFTIYDWKEYHEFGEDTLIRWHIGGEDVSATKKGKAELKKALLAQVE
jgi:hypothetical protein